MALLNKNNVKHASGVYLPYQDVVYNYESYHPMTMDYIGKVDEMPETDYVLMPDGSVRLATNGTLIMFASSVYLYVNESWRNVSPMDLSVSVPENRLSRIDTLATDSAPRYTLEYA